MALFLFQQLLLKPKFSGVEKIKTIGSTYMAATGLNVAAGQDNQQVGSPFKMTLQVSKSSPGRLSPFIPPIRTMWSLLILVPKS